MVLYHWSRRLACIHTYQCTSDDNICHQATSACKALLPSDMVSLEAPTRWVGVSNLRKVSNRLFVPAPRPF